MIKSLYDLMGPNVHPPADQTSKDQHIETVFKKLNLDKSVDNYLTYNEFHQLITQVSIYNLFLFVYSLSTPFYFIYLLEH